VIAKLWHDPAFNGSQCAQTRPLSTNQLTQAFIHARFTNLGIAVLVVAGLAAVTGCGPSTTSADAPLPATDWHEFQGTWTAAGSRQTIRLGDDRRASIGSFDGSLVLTGASRRP
jgi:hypothetical protein